MASCPLRFVATGDIAKEGNAGQSAEKRHVVPTAVRLPEDAAELRVSGEHTNAAACTMSVTPSNTGFPSAETKAQVG